MNNFYRVHLCINYFYRAVIWFGNGTDGDNRPSKGSPKISECLVRKLSGGGHVSELISVDKCNGRSKLRENHEFCARLPVDARSGLGMGNGKGN